MSVRRFNNPDQSTLTENLNQSVPVGTPVGFLGVKFHKGLGVCCGDTITNCAYDITPSGALTAVTAVTFVGNSGSNVTVTFASVSTPKAIRTAIAKALMDNGIDPYYNGDDFKGISIEGKRIRIVGTVQIVSVTISATAVAAVQKCSFATQCTYKLAFEYETDPKKVGVAATGGTQIGTTDGYETGASATVITDVTTAVGTAGFTLANTVAVVENTSAGVYEVEFTVIGSMSVYYNGVSLQSQGCNQTFVA